jgi:uncharacterized membrane protein
MGDVPVQIIVAAFKDEDTASQALRSLQQAQKERLIKIDNAAVLHKDKKGKLHIKETADMGGRKGAALGGVAGAAIGLIAGPALLVPAAVGALVGGLTARLRDTGFKNARLEALGERLQPGSSAIVAVVEHTWVAQVQAAMAEAGADVLTAQIGADISEQLEAGHEVAYTAIATREGFAAARLTTGEAGGVEGDQIVVDDSGAYEGSFVATKEGFAVVDKESMEAGVPVTGEEDEGKAQANKPEEESKPPAE